MLDTANKPCMQQFYSQIACKKYWSFGFDSANHPLVTSSDTPEYQYLHQNGFYEYLAIDVSPQLAVFSQIASHTHHPKLPLGCAQEC